MSQQLSSLWKKLGMAILVGGMCLSVKASDSKRKPATYHHCSWTGSTANNEGYQTTSEIYTCDEGEVELKGKWTKFIEYDSIFRQQLGRPEGEPYPAADAREHFRWCPVKNSPVPELELCGLWPEKGELIKLNEDEKCKPSKRGSPYSEDCVCQSSGRSLLCKDRETEAK